MSFLSMRLGLVVSVVGHGTIVLVALIALAHAPLMDAAPAPTITVDLVPEDETPPQKEKKTELPADAPQAAARQTEAAASSQAAAKPPSPQPADLLPSQLASLSPALAPQSPQPETVTSERVYIPLLPGVDRLGSDFGFDAPADSTSKLTRDEVAAFQAHLQKCWKPAADLAGASQLRAVVRIAMTPQGALAGEPLLIRASASMQGPKLVAAAIRALRQCQPFPFLPADKYQEWKILDLSFSPQGLAGG